MVSAYAVEISQHVLLTLWQLADGAGETAAGYAADEHLVGRCCGCVRHAVEQCDGAVWRQWCVYGCLLYGSCHGVFHVVLADSCCAGYFAYVWLPLVVLAEFSIDACYLRLLRLLTLRQRDSVLLLCYGMLHGVAHMPYGV